MFVYIICGYFKWIWCVAEFVVELIGFDGEIQIDQCLCEIDYGFWGGKIVEEFDLEFGVEVCEEWDFYYCCLVGVDWLFSEVVLCIQVLVFMVGVVEWDGLIVLIIFNGILCYMYNVLLGFDVDVKVKIGNMCVVEISGNSGICLFWNEKLDVVFIRFILGQNVEKLLFVGQWFFFLVID